MRRRLAEVDRQWVQERTLHSLDTAVGNLMRGDDVNDLIYQQFGCMSRAEAELHFEVITANGHKGYEPGPVFRQSAPGRGTPRRTFRKKLRGLVPNRLMSTLVHCAFQGPRGVQRRSGEGGAGEGSQTQHSTAAAAMAASEERRSQAGGTAHGLLQRR